MQSNSPSLDTLSTQELEALGNQLNADMRANSAAWTQFQPSDNHRSLALLLQWQADERATLSSHTQTKGN